jgi:hypothetical protein
VARRDLDRKALYSAAGHARLLRWQEGKMERIQATASQRADLISIGIAR